MKIHTTKSMNESKNEEESASADDGHMKFSPLNSTQLRT